MVARSLITVSSMMLNDFLNADYKRALSFIYWYCNRPIIHRHLHADPYDYAYSWLALLTLIIIDRRVLWIHHRLFRLRKVLRWLHFFTPFVERNFESHSFLQMPFFLLVCCSNTLVLLLYPKINLIETIASRIGEVILINLIVILLVSSRHSLFWEFSGLSQPETMWAHKILGNLVILEVFGHTALSVRRNSHIACFCASLVDL